MPNMIYSPSEQTMWEAVGRRATIHATDEEINSKYTSRDWRIVTEANREQLPNFVEALRRPGWMELRPFYQRRLRWDVERQSKLIESFVMNIPVPPLFVYESDFAKYEVMDGQQRINTIREFYSNGLELAGLEQWPELNGKTYSKLPSEIKKGIDRRSISYIVLLKESAGSSPEEQMMVKQQVFERLNTGGVELTRQEIRNCLFQGEFNSFLVDLATNALHRAAWKLPPFTSSEKDLPSQQLLSNKLYSKMADVEIVLRFFALRHADRYTRGLQGFLDLYMHRARKFTTEDLTWLRAMFNETLDLASAIYGALLFRPWDVRVGTWEADPHVAFADAVMVGISRNLSVKDRLVSSKALIVERTKELFVRHADDGLFMGRGNTKGDVVGRIEEYVHMLAEAIRV